LLLGLRDNWMEECIDLFRFIDAKLTHPAKENLVGEAFFYTHRKVLPEKLSVFKKQFAVLYNPNAYPTKPKRMGGSPLPKSGKTHKGS
jgi:hypothetical protein